MDLVEALLTIPVVHPGAQRHASLAPVRRHAPRRGPVLLVADVDMAFDTAGQAQVRWASTYVADRKRVMLRFHDLLHVPPRRGPGPHPVGDRQDPDGRAQGAARGVRCRAALCPRRRSACSAPDRKLGVFPLLTKVAVEHQPVGVVGNIAPWNYPLFLAGADAIPALMAGNAVVLKPDHQTSLTALCGRSTSCTGPGSRPGHAGRAGVRPGARPGDHRASRLHDVHRVQRRRCERSPAGAASG